MIETSPLGIHIDGIALGHHVALGKSQRGVYAVAVNQYKAARSPVTQSSSGQPG